MLSINRTALGAAVALSLAPPLTNAALVNVGGVTWDTDATAPVQDFFADLSFDQWFQSAESPIDDQDRTTVSFSDPGALVGTFLSGSGGINAINGVNNIEGSPVPETTPSRFCPGCELTYVFGGIEVADFNIITDPILGTFVDFDFDITNAFANIYVDDAQNWPQGVRPDVETAMDGELFLSLSFANFGFSPFPNVIGGSTSAQLRVTGGMAAAYFDTDPATLGTTTMLPGADFTYTASSQFADSADFTNGTGEIRADSIAVPEPASLTLLGMGLFGLGAAQQIRRLRSRG